MKTDVCIEALPSFSVDGLLCEEHEHLCHCPEDYGDTHKSIGRLVLLFLLTPSLSLICMKNPLEWPKSKVFSTCPRYTGGVSSPLG